MGSTILQRSNICAVLLALSVIVIVPYIPNLRVVHRVNFEVAIALLFAIYLWKLNPWIAMFMGLSTFSMVFPFYDKESYFAFQAIFYGLILYAVVITRVENTDVLLNAMCVIVLANIALMLLQIFNLDPIFAPVKGGDDPVVGFMGNPDHTSAMFAFCFPAFMRKRWIYLIPFIVVSMVICQSLGGITALIAGLIFYAGVKGHKFWPSAVVLSVAIAFFAWRPYETHSLAVRIDAWLETMKYYQQHWVFGSGIGHFKVQIGSKVLYHIINLRWGALHNEFLQGLFEMGVLLPVIVIGYYVRCYWKFRQPFYSYRRSALIPMMGLVIVSINSMVNFPLHVAPTAMLAVVWMAILEIKLRSPKEAQ